MIFAHQNQEINIMKKQQIQNLFNQPYNQAQWKQFLGQTFANIMWLPMLKN
ncbi:MAG: hypothetical protein RLZZ86_1733 [Cyanobacteriota bacterium]